MKTIELIPNKQENYNLDVLVCIADRAVTPLKSGSLMYEAI